MPDREYLTPVDLEKAGIAARTTLAIWRCRGVGPPYLKLGRHIRYRRVDVDAWLQSCVRQPGRPAAPRTVAV